MIKDYGTYKGVPIYQDFNVMDGEQVYIGNGQGCRTFWFKSVPEAKRFIDCYREQMKITNLGGVMGLIPSELCRTCKGHYSWGSPNWKRARRDNCEDYKEQLKGETLASALI